MFVRKIKTKSGTYLAEVETFRDGGKVRQRTVNYIGRIIDGKPVRLTRTNEIRAAGVRRYLDVKVVDKLAEDLSLKGTIPSKALIFVYSQLIDRPSINKLEVWLKTTEILNMLKIESISTQELYDTLTDLNEIDFESVENNIVKALSKYEAKNNPVIIDVTDTYFQGKKVEGIPRKGKEGRNKKLLQIVLAVTEGFGFPLFYKTYPGNISNLKIFEDIAKDLWKNNYSFVIMDRGMGSSNNIDMMLHLKFKVICGLRKNKKLIPEFLSKINREEIFSKANMVQLKNTKVYFKSFDYKKGKLLAIYNPSLEILKRENYYETNDNEDIARYLGYSFIYHNTDMDDADAIRKYFDKDIVERAFKQMKGILNLRPVRVWMRSHIEAHVKICYMAYAILSLLSYKTRKMGLSGSEALEKLRSGYKVYLEDQKSGFKWNTVVTLENAQKDILKRCSVKT